MTTPSARLRDACKQLGYEYESIEQDRLAQLAGDGDFDRVEDLAKRMYEAKGYLVDRSECAAFFLIGRIVSAISNPSSARLEASMLGLDLEGPATPIGDEAAFAEVFERAIAADALRRMYDHWCATPARALWPRHAGTLLKWEFLSRLVTEHTDAVRRLVFARLTQYPGMGWPDLTVLRDQAIHFVEVKLGKDTFTNRQKDWAEKISLPLSLRPTLLHVVGVSSN